MIVTASVAGNPTDQSPGATRFSFTGEWWQENLNLLYLRARWYAPETGTSLSVDPVESQPPYAYVGGNVVNRADPSGMTPPNECDYCKFKAGGYAEGYSTYVNFALLFPFTGGFETVYDFATMERAAFYFTTNWLAEIEKKIAGWSNAHLTFDFQIGTGVDEVGIIGAYSNLHNFKSQSDIVYDYEGIFTGITIGANSNWLQLGRGNVYVRGEGDDPIIGDGVYGLFGAGVDFPLLKLLGKNVKSPLKELLTLSYTYFKTQYFYLSPDVPGGDHEWYTDTGQESGKVTDIEIQRMAQDIYDGNHLPFPFDQPVLNDFTDVLGQASRRASARAELWSTWEKHKTYFTEYFRECNLRSE